MNRTNIIIPEALSKVSKVVNTGGTSPQPPSVVVHERQHAMNNSLDHAPADAADYGKIPKANVTTGVWELVDQAADDILHWDGTKYVPYGDKMAVDFPYFYSAGNNPQNDEQSLLLDAKLTAVGFTSTLADDTYLYQGDLSHLGLIANRQEKVSGDYDFFSLAFVSSGALNMVARRYSGDPVKANKIYIGDISPFADVNAEHILIDDKNKLFHINMTMTRIKGHTETLRGNYRYDSQILGIDTEGDWRTYSDGNGFYTQYCTVGNATKGAGTWVTKHTIQI